MPTQAYVHLVSADSSLLVTLVKDFLSVDNIEFINMLLIGTVMLVITANEGVTCHIGSRWWILHFLVLGLRNYC